MKRLIEKLKLKLSYWKLRLEYSDAELKKYLFPELKTAEQVKKEKKKSNRRNLWNLAGRFENFLKKIEGKMNLPEVKTEDKNKENEKNTTDQSVDPEVAEIVEEMFRKRKGIVDHEFYRIRKIFLASKIYHRYYYLFNPVFFWLFVCCLLVYYFNPLEYMYILYENFDPEDRFNITQEELKEKKSILTIFFRLVIKLLYNIYKYFRDKK